MEEGDENINDQAKSTKSIKFKKKADVFRYKA